MKQTVFGTTRDTCVADCIRTHFTLKPRLDGAEDEGMDTRIPTFASFSGDHRGWRQHRFMESADINTAFREFFRPLRANIRRGMTIEGQLYGIEMDGCIPGELLGTDWIPPALYGMPDPARLTDAMHRRALFDRLLAAPRPEALFAYVCERPADAGVLLLYVEIASADASYVAEYPIRPGRGWHRRELVKAPYHRLGLVAGNDATATR